MRMGYSGKTSTVVSMEMVSRGSVARLVFASLGKAAREFSDDARVHLPLWWEYDSFLSWSAASG